MNSLPVIAILCLSVMMVFPSTLPRVHALPSNGNNYWSNYGPNVNSLLFKVYQDFSGMFSDFNAGQIDITDWPIQAPDLAGFVNNPDFFVTTKQAEFGLFHVDINHQDPFLTKTWQDARTTVPATLSITSSVACAACPAGTFQLVVHLSNQEESAPVTDANNFVTATITGQSSPTATKADDANPAPAGTYTLAPLSGVPSYGISTTIYSGSVTLFTTGTPGAGATCANGQTCTATFNINYNSGSTKKASASGIAIGRAISHLVDKPSYLTGTYLTPPGGTPLAACDDVFAPPSQGLMAGAGACDHSSSPPLATLQAECNDPNIAALFGLVPGTVAGTCAAGVVSLFNLKADSITGAATCGAGTVGVSCFPSQSATPPIGYSGLLDLAAACVYLLEAGFTTTGAGTGTFAQQCNSIVGGTGHINNNGAQIIMYIRTHPPRKAFGTIIADELNFMFGTPAPAGGTVCYGGPPSFTCSLTPVYFTIGQIASIVFSVATVADWNLYTGGFTLGSTPDQLFSLYSSQFASTLCGGGTASTFPNNYPLFCDPAYDTQANAGENVPGATFAGFQAAAILGATRGADVPMYSGANLFVGLNAWSQQPVGAGTGASLVSVKGHGFEAGTGDLLNMQPTPGYVPANSLYYASGCNPANGVGCTSDGQSLIRRSLAQTTLHVSPWTFTTAWEAEPLVQIYDSMLAVDPNTGGLCQTQPGGTSHCIDWMTTFHEAPTFDSATGRSTQNWHLRSDIFFHDGVAVTAHDVCFSILSYRDAPSANFFSSVSNVVSCTATSAKIAQIVYTGQSPFMELNLGGVFIVPEHVWAPICGGLVGITDQCTNPTNLASPTPIINGVATDPVAAGYMIGSGAWVCNSAIGVSFVVPPQPSCSQNANGSNGGQALGAGARMLLKRNLAYMRCCSDVQNPENGLSTTNLQALQWADANKDGKVTILDIALAATVFGHTCTATDPTACYFAHALYSANPAANSVDIGDIATIAAEFDQGLTAPFLGTPTGSFTATAPPGLTQYDPNTDPYRVSLPNSGGFLYLQGGTETATTFTLHTDPCGAADNCRWGLYAETGGTVTLRFDKGDNGPTHTVICEDLTMTQSCTGTFTAGTALDIVVYNSATGKPSTAPSTVVTYSTTEFLPSN